MQRKCYRTDEALKEWQDEVSKLTTAEEREEFFSQVKDIKSFAGYVQAIEKNIKDTNKSSRTLKVARWMRPVFMTMNMIAPTAVNYSPVDPRISGVVLGAITNVLFISTKYVDYQEELEQMISDMACKLDFAQEYGNSIFPKDLQLRKALIKVYAVMLKFCVEASRLFVSEKGKKRSAVLRLGKSSWETFQWKFGDVKVEFAQRLEDFKLAVGACRDRAILQLGQRQTALVDLVTEATSSLQQKFDEVRRREELKSLQGKVMIRGE